MKARTLFRENGTVIHTRSSLIDRLQPWVMALLVTTVMLVLPALLDPVPLADDSAAITELMALHEQELQAMQAEVALAYVRGQADARQAMPAECKRRSQL